MSMVKGLGYSPIFNPYFVGKIRKMFICYVEGDILFLVQILLALVSHSLVFIISCEPAFGFLQIFMDI